MGTVDDVWFADVFRGVNTEGTWPSAIFCAATIPLRGLPELITYGIVVLFVGKFRMQQKYNVE